jgi:hypothetical protein
MAKNMTKPTLLAQASSFSPISFHAVSLSTYLK